MQLQLLLNDERQKLWIERLKKEITKNQAELDKELPSFREIEKDYLNWKAKVDALQSLIANDQIDLNDLVHAQNFPDKVVHKPRLVNQFTKEEVQRQVVPQKKGYDSNGLKPLKRIKWSELVVPVLKGLNRFMTYKDLFTILVERKTISGDRVTSRRFSSAMSTTKAYFKIHEQKIGLLDWFDESGVPKPEYLNNFIGTTKKVV